MAVTALVLYTLWAALAFGLRSLIQHRRTGDTGLRINGGPPGSLPWWTRILFVAALVIGALGPILDLVDVLEPIAALDAAAVQGVGAVVTLAGIAATVATQHAMGDSWRVGVDPTERTDLVKTGPFRIVRNPIFTAMAVTAIGLALMVPNVIALVGLATLAVALELQVRLVEEPYLQATHGRAYTDYAATVGRFLPKLGR